MKAITKKDLINYLKKSPENLNFNIFGTMLDDFRNTYEADEQIVNKIKNIITNIIEDGGSISPEDDTITELVDLVTELLPEKMIIKPVGTLEITENGTHDVTEYASVVTNVAGKEDLINLIERDITTLNIPDGVINIGDYAFTHCQSLTSITIPNSVTNIGDYAFSGSGLTSITIPNSVTSTGNCAFYNCDRLASLEILNGVTSIDTFAFSDCNRLASLEIPNSVTNIGMGAFHGCDSLNDVYFTGTETEWNAIIIGGDNDALANATKHFNYTLSN